ncbi:MAG: carboxypeptidase-like regulatory domain-containing protein, partial [Candidatus Acidiferrales bacterium]
MNNLGRGKLAAGLLAALGLACILGSPMAFAQGSQGRISGTVRDATGAVIPGALVTLRNEASGTVLRTTADVSGLYDFNYIPAATYTLRVSTKGFKAYVLTGIHVAPGAVLEENAALHVGTQTQTVQVNGNAVDLIPKSSG